MDTEVPEQLIGLVEPIYERQYRVLIKVEGVDSLEVKLFDTPSVINGVKELWLEEGQVVTLQLPEEYGPYELAYITSPTNLSRRSDQITLTVKEPIVITLHYYVCDIAFLLDIPVVGSPLFYLARLSGKLIGVKGAPALIFSVAAFIVAPATGVYVAVCQVRGRAQKRAATVMAAEKGIEIVVDSISSPKTIEHPYAREAVRAKGTLSLPSELRKVLEGVIGAGASSSGLSAEETPSSGVSLEMDAVKLEAEKLFRDFVEGRISWLDVQHIFHVALDAEKYSLLVAALSRGGQITGDPTYLGLDREVMELMELLVDPMIPFFALVCEDVDVARRILEKASREIGIRVAFAEGLSEASSHSLARRLQKMAEREGAQVIAVLRLNKSVEDMLIRTIPVLRVKTVLITRSAWLRPRLVLGNLDGDQYSKLALILLAKRELLGYLSWDQLTRLGRLAEGCRGILTIERFVEILEEEGGAEEAINSLTVEELSRIFKPEEIRLLLSVKTVEELREVYMSLVRQLSPGSDPVREWSNFYERLRKMGAIKSEA